MEIILLFISNFYIIGEIEYPLQLLTEAQEGRHEVGRGDWQREAGSTAQRSSKSTINLGRLLNTLVRTEFRLENSRDHCGLECGISKIFNVSNGASKAYFQMHLKIKILAVNKQRLLPIPLWTCAIFRYLFPPWCYINLTENYQNNVVDR